MRSQIPLKFIYYIMVKAFMKFIFWSKRYLSLSEGKCLFQDKKKIVENFYHIKVELNDLKGQQTKINDLVSIFEEILYFFLLKTQFPFLKVFMKLLCFDSFVKTSSKKKNAESHLML